MNKFPAWKYTIIAVALVVGFLYAVPNLYGDSLAVQISGLRANKADAALQTTVESTLKTANIATNGALIGENSVKFRFADADTQLKARDAIQASLGQGYVVALNQVPNTPDWLTALGAKPMYLGLDLRGGVHFLLQVDMKTVVDKAVERYTGETRALLREKKIYYTGLARESDRVVVRFKDESLREQALKALTSQYSADLVLREQGSGEDLQLLVSLKPETIKRTQESALDQNITTLRNRVNELGVSEPIVQRTGDDRILVQLAGVQDTARAKDIIGRTASLEVRLVAEDLASSPSRDAFAAYKNQPAPFGTTKLFDENGDVVLVRNALVITGERVTDAQPGFDPQTNASIVNVSLDSAGGRAMTQTTRENVKKRMAMILVEKGKSEVLTWPSINGEFGSRFMITGMPSTQEAKNLALLLRAGSLAAPMEIIEERTIGPSLGAENIEMGKQSVLYGFIMIAVFMIIYYMLFGVVSVIALASNLLFLVALLSMLQATLTLPGIAAIALTLGMAIDANVLINERVREELRSGMSPQMAIQAGYERAFDTILDSNITTLIAGLALLIWGSGPVRGFAVVHCLGILTSIFSAVLLSRGIVNLIYGGRKRVAKLSIGDTSWSAKAHA